MSKLTAEDFYYGAFLSALLNNSPDGKPCLFDDPGSDSRRIYRLETNQTEETFFYCKYRTSPSKSNDGLLWTFNFSYKEAETLQELHNQNKQLRIVLICVVDGLAESEIAIVNSDEAFDCLGIERGVKNYSISIKYLKNKHGLRMYGSGRSDKVDGKDNTLVVRRNRIKHL